MSHYGIAMILSVMTACCTAAASWVPDRRKAYLLQTVQCALYAAASWFFGIYASVAVMILCAVRNYLTAVDRYTLRVCAVFCVLTAVLGLACNNAGAIGLISVLATLQYTVCSCFIKGLIGSKWNIFVNLTLWVIYDTAVHDYASLVMDFISVVTCAAAICRIRHKELKEKHSTER